EGVGADQVEEVGSRHLVNAAVKERSTEGGRGHGQRGFQEAEVADAGQASVALDQVPVQGEDLVEREENDGHLLGQALEDAAILAVGRRHDPLELCGTAPTAYRRDDDDLTVG